MLSECQHEWKRCVSNKGDRGWAAKGNNRGDRQHLCLFSISSPVYYARLSTEYSSLVLICGQKANKGQHTCCCKYPYWLVTESAAQREIELGGNKICAPTCVYV